MSKKFRFIDTFIYCRATSTISFHCHFKPVVSKVFEKNVYNQLYHYLNSNKLLLGCQSGFRSLHSTLSALLEATDSWSVNIDNGLLNGVVFIDLTKAFDTIDHKIILRKMSYLDVDQAAIKWFSSYLSGRTPKMQCQWQNINCSNPQLRCAPRQYIGDTIGAHFLEILAPVHTWRFNVSCFEVLDANKVRFQLKKGVLVVKSSHSQPTF